MEIVFITPLWICKTEKKLVLLTVKVKNACLYPAHFVKPLGKEALGKGALGSIREGMVITGWEIWVGKTGW